MAGVATGVVRPVMQAKIADIPVGKAAVLVAAMGVGDVGKALVHRVSGGKLPQWLTGLILAWGLTNTKMIRNFLGADVAELAALAIVADTINDQFNLRQRTSDILSGLFGGTTVSSSPPTFQKNLGQATPVQLQPAGVGGLYRGIF